MFSPDGRLLQVEYAKKTVRQGSAAIGIVCKDGVLLVTDKRIVDKLVVAEAIEKIWQIDDHIAATASGIISDARVLIERAQLKAQQHKVAYDSDIDILTIVKDMCAIKQVCTQSGGLRPFGVSVLVAGVDIRASVIGEGEPEIEEILSKEYKKDISIEDALKLAIKALNQILDKDFEVERIDAAYITTKDKKFTKVERSHLDRVLKEVRKSK